MEACKMCWKTKETHAVFEEYPEAVVYCKGCIFEIHRVINAVAYALDTTGFAIVLAGRELTILRLGGLGTTYISLSTGELVEGRPPDLARETGSPLEARSQGEVEGGSPEGGLGEGRTIQESKETPPGGPEADTKGTSRSKLPKT